MKKEIKFWQVDAFASEAFKGNPAAVFVLEEEIDDATLQSIAIEMNQSESAFIFLRNGQNPMLRWFTPTFEIDLCGHATLASSHVYLSYIHPELSDVTFDTKFVGPLNIARDKDQYMMDFPIRKGEKLDTKDIPQIVLEALGNRAPLEAWKARDLMLVYDDAEWLRAVDPDFTLLKKYPDFVAITAKSDEEEYDFVSRFFTAGDGLDEDPVTGSAHCTLTPYWAERLKKTKLKAYQASKRGGSLDLAIDTHIIQITGKAVTVIAGRLSL